MTNVDPGVYILYINNLCTGNEAKVMYSILACGANTKDNTDYIVKSSGFSKNHFYTIRKRLYEKGYLMCRDEIYIVDFLELCHAYKEEFKC
jgi:hypothetical protein